MNHFSAVITSASLILGEWNDGSLLTSLIGEEPRPADFADADMTLAWYGYARIEAWDLSGAGLSASIAPMNNLFNGVRAARFDDALGTTHAEGFELAAASTVQNGDLVTDADESTVYVVGGSSIECGVTKMHMVAEGKTWADRYTGEFTGLVRVARRIA